MPDTPDITPLLKHAVPFVLVMFRIAGVFALAPMIGSVSVPVRAKALFSFAMAWAVYSAVPSGAIPEAPHDSFSLIPLLVTELLIGLVLGVIASVPLLSLEMAGTIAGQSIGFGLARVYNPESDVDSDLLGQLLFYIASGVFTAFGGLNVLFGAILHSFSTVPLGAFSAERVPLPMLMGVLGSGTELALRVAAPVAGITLLLVIVFGAIGKTMPQINIMTVGFTIKVMAGLAMLAAAVMAVREAAGDHIDVVLADLLRWVRAQ